MRLVYDKTGTEVKIGDFATTFRGETVIVSGIEKPRHGGSTGRVYVREDKVRERGSIVFDQGYFPSVIGATWIDREDQA